VITSRGLLQGLAVLLTAAVPAFAAPSPNPKIDRGLQESLRHGGATQRVIISVKPGYRAEIRQSLEKHGDRIRSEHPSVDALTADIHSDDVNELANHPWVLAVSIDATVSAGAAAGPQGTFNGAQGNVSAGVMSGVALFTGPPNTLRQTLGLPRASSSLTPSGSGVGVAIIDSGIAPLDDFAGRITGFYDFTKGGIPVAPFDDYGHGTHVAGLIGSSGLLSNNQFQGVAPNVTFVGLKVLDKNGQGRTSDVIRAIEYVTANRVKLRVQIINLSLGHPIFAPAKDDPMVQAVEKATAAGLIVVASAGNFGQNRTSGATGYTGLTSPGNAPSCITVGAAVTGNTVTRDDDTVADYSSRGPSWYDAFAKPDVVAPGHHLVSDAVPSATLFGKLPTLRTAALNGRVFFELSGSSMAAAVASGVVADIIDAHNRAGYFKAKPLTVNAVKAILQFSAIPVAGADYLTQGAGEVNAGGAIALASAIDTSVTPGDWWLRSSVPALTVVGTKLYEWGRTVVWGETVLTGNLVFTSLESWSPASPWGAHVAWDGNFAQVKAANIVWGSASTWASNIVWGDRVIGELNGDNIVWGTLAGDNIVWGSLDGDNIVWGNCDGDNIVWGSATGDNIVWGSSSGDNIVWGSSREEGDNIVWGNLTEVGDNIVWGTSVLKGGIF
jgi:serine protease AprX